MKRGLATVVLLAVVWLGVGCSGFERDWRRAGGRAGLPEGRWIGSWRSDRSGHTGALRCVVVRPEGGRRDPGWRFHYHARWLGVMSAGFRTRQPVEDAGGGRFVSKGRWTVPRWAGGDYDYEIEIIGNEFRGRFRSRNEHGTFLLTRPAGD